MAGSEIAMFWTYIASSINRLPGCFDGLTVEELNWKPLPPANSLYTLGFHTIENTSENILTVFASSRGSVSRIWNFLRWPLIQHL